MIGGAVIAVNAAAVGARCGQLARATSGLDSDANQFAGSAGSAAAASGGSAADAFARFNDLGTRTAAAGVTALNNTRVFMGKAALEIEGLDTRLARSTLATGQEGS